MTIYMLLCILYMYMCMYMYIYTHTHIDTYLSTNCFLQIVSFLRCHFRSEKPFLKTEQIIIIIIINELLFANSFSREGIFNGKSRF